MYTHFCITNVFIPSTIYTDKIFVQESISSCPDSPLKKNKLAEDADININIILHGELDKFLDVLGNVPVCNTDQELRNRDLDEDVVGVSLFELKDIVENFIGNHIVFRCRYEE